MVRSVKVEKAVGLVVTAWLLSTGCVFGFDTTVPESGGVDEGDGAGVDATDGGELGDAPDVETDGDAAAGGDGAPEPDAGEPTDADASGVDVNAGPDVDVVVPPDADADTGAEDDADTNPAEDADADADVTPPLRCSDLDCDADGRVCDEGDDITDARCGQCLSGFIEEGETCVAPSCRGAGDCTPNPAASEWSTCGGYADACAREGTQTRQVYTGDCEGGRCEVASVEQTRACPDLRETDGEPCVLGAAVGDCASGVCVVLPPQVTGVSASDGTSPLLVRVTWSAVESATGYKVYRDGTLLTPTPLTTLQFDDSSATAGGPPAQVTGLSATAATDRITLSWTAAAGTGTPGVAATYTVTALNATGEGPASAGDAGNRAGFALSGYEVRINGSGSWLSAGTSTSYADTSAPAGSISVTNVTASDGTSTAHVQLSGTATSTPGASRSYEVRAVNLAGAGAASASVSRQRSVGTPSVQWQRSSGTTASGFSDISGATSALYNDTGAPNDGSVRHYRLVASASGATTVTSSSDSGFRQTATPPICDTTDKRNVGEDCTAASDCCSGLCQGNPSTGAGLCTQECDSFVECNPIGSPNEMFCLDSGTGGERLCAFSDYGDSCAVAADCLGQACMVSNSSRSCTWQCRTGRDCPSGSACGLVPFGSGAGAIELRVCTPVGSRCINFTDCLSGTCLTDDNPLNNYCTTFCSPTDANACPSGYSCSLSEGVRVCVRTG